MVKHDRNMKVLEIEKIYIICAFCWFLLVMKLLISSILNIFVFLVNYMHVQCITEHSLFTATCFDIL